MEAHVFFGNGKTFIINSLQGIRHTKRIRIQTKQEPQENSITTPIQSCCVVFIDLERFKK
jgi:hypothetical protein